MIHTDTAEDAVAVDAERGVIPGNFRDVMNEISNLDQRLSLLGERLEPVLRPSQPEPADPDNSGPEVRMISDLAENLRFAANRVVILSRFVEDLNDRLDL